MLSSNPTKLTRLEDAVGKVIYCPRAGYARLVSKVEPTLVYYAMEIAPGVWRDLGATGRGYVESDFLDGYIVEDATVIRAI